MARSSTDQQVELIHLSAATLFIIGFSGLILLSGATLFTVGSTAVPVAVGAIGLIAIAAVTYVIGYERGGERWMLGRAVGAAGVILGSLLVGAAETTGIGALSAVGTAVIVLGALVFVTVRWLPDSFWDRFDSESDHEDEE